MSIDKINAINPNMLMPEKFDDVPERPEEYVVQAHDTLTKISKQYGMTVDEFCAWTKLNKNAVLSVGQKIPLKRDKVPQGRGLLALINRYGMDKERFCALNGIPLTKFNSYVPQVDEMFYVCQGLKKQSTTTAPSSGTTPAPSSTPPASQPSGSGSGSTGTTTASTRVTLNNGRTFTAADLQRDAINSAKRSSEYRNCDVSYIQRPLPNIVNGKIEATVEIRYPTSSTGSHAGEVIILNPGHGGYQQDNGFFDSGAISARLDGSGGHVPIEEWKVAKSYANALASKLQARGATVVIVQGAVRNGGMDAQNYLEGLIKGNKGPTAVRNLMKNTPNSKKLFMSIHFDSGNGDMNCSVIAQKSRGQAADAGDVRFANNIKNELAAGFSLLTPAVVRRGLYVTHAMGSSIPAVLLEVGDISNAKVQASALSSSDIDKYTNCLVRAIDKTMNPPRSQKK